MLLLKMKKIFTLMDRATHGFLFYSFRPNNFQLLLRWSPGTAQDFSIMDRASPFLMTFRRTKCGLCFTSSNILAMYSPKMARANKLIEPKNSMARITVVVPLGAKSG